MIMKLNTKNFYYVLAAVLWAVTFGVFYFITFVLAAGTSDYLFGLFAFGLCTGVSITQTYDAFRATSLCGKVYREVEGQVVEVEI